LPLADGDAIDGNQLDADGVAVQELAAGVEAAHMDDQEGDGYAVNAPVHVSAQAV